MHYQTKHLPIQTGTRQSFSIARCQLCEYRLPCVARQTYKVAPRCCAPRIPLAQALSLHCSGKCLVTGGQLLLCGANSLLELLRTLHTLLPQKAIFTNALPGLTAGHRIPCLSFSRRGLPRKLDIVKLQTRWHMVPQLARPDELQLRRQPTERARHREEAQWEPKRSR